MRVRHQGVVVVIKAVVVFCGHRGGVVVEAGVVVVIVEAGSSLRLEAAVVVVVEEAAHVFIALRADLDGIPGQRENEATNEYQPEPAGTTSQLWAHKALLKVGLALSGPTVGYGVDGTASIPQVTAPVEPIHGCSAGAGVASVNDVVHAKCGLF
ncbi:hypothetical protein BDZ89DRAFT_1054424 [Hymenopellis radicata]|nr:hypothetical protein BDZ89DRAFT_1054424 [Hymenopellis radicata]